MDVLDYLFDQFIMQNYTLKLCKTLIMAMSGQQKLMENYLLVVHLRMKGHYVV